MTTCEEAGLWEASEDDDDHDLSSASELLEAACKLLEALDQGTPCFVRVTCDCLHVKRFVMRHINVIGISKVDRSLLLKGC